MTTNYVTMDQTTPQNINAGDTLYEVQGVFIEGGIAMTGNGGGNETVDIYCGVLGAISDYNGTSSGGDQITIGTTGYVAYSETAIDQGAIGLSGGGNSVVNAGTISASNYGMAIYISDVLSDGVTPVGTDLTVNDTVINSGTISGTETAGVTSDGVVTIYAAQSQAIVQNSGSILASDGGAGIVIDGGADTTILNTGTITGDIFASGLSNLITNGGTISGTLDIEGDYNSVVNTGSIVGDDTFVNFQSSDTNTFDGSLGHMTGTVFAGIYANMFTGSAGADKFDLSNGTTTLDAGAGNDTITMNTNLNAGQTIDGGAGNDTVTLNGDYSAGFAFSPTTMVNVEKLTMFDGHSNNLTTDDATVAAGATLTVDASVLSGTNTLTFDGSAETDGRFVVTGGAGNDVIKTGSGNDLINGGTGNDKIYAGTGIDRISGGDGNDLISGTGGFITAADKIDGGIGTDQVFLTGNYTGANALVMTATTMVNVETLKMGAGFSYSVTTNDTTVASGATLTVDASALTTA